MLEPNFSSRQVSQAEPSPTPPARRSSRHLRTATLLIGDLDSLPLIDWKQRLDKHGFFFQKKVQLVVERTLGKTAESEVPARAEPAEPSNETLIDFRLRVDGAHSPSFELVFECKKTYEKEWLFLIEKRNPDKFRSISLRQVIEPVPDAGGNLSSFYEFSADSLKLGTDHTHEICEYGFEAERAKDTADTKPVRDFARQVSIGLYQSLKEARALAASIEEVFRGSKSETHMAVLPLVVTNRPPLLGLYDADKVDMSSGQVNMDGFTMLKRDWLVYRYHALQDVVFMEFPESMVGTEGMDESEMARYHASLVRKASNIDMFVVAAPSLPDFLPKLTAAISGETSSIAEGSTSQQ